MGNLPEALGGHAHTLSHQNWERVCLVMESPDKEKTKLHLMKVEYLRFWSDSFFSTGNLHFSNYQHPLNLSKVRVALFNIPLKSITARAE